MCFNIPRIGKNTYYITKGIDYNESLGSYVTTKLGILNFLLIIFIIPTWLPIVYVLDPKYIIFYPRNGLNISFLTFAPLAFLLECVILVFNLFFFQNTNKKMNRYFILKDILFGLSILGLAIVSAIAEYKLNSTNFNSGNPDLDNDSFIFNGNISIYYFYNRGAYAVAAGFGFLVSILYSLHAFYCTKDILNSKCYNLADIEH